jgi:hypothetical protein
VTLLVDGGALTRLAVLLFALPLAALLVVAWGGSILAVQVGLAPDLVAALMGLGALGLTFSLMARSGGALLRMLKIRARLE